MNCKQFHLSTDRIGTVSIDLVMSPDGSALTRVIIIGSQEPDFQDNLMINVRTILDGL
uniref:Uncharacterized protein n=1 Tax=Arion vulgaris TaxID=1028688 RepID=A0A0B7BXJ9_9EUPU